MLDVDPAWMRAWRGGDAVPPWKKDWGGGDDICDMDPAWKRDRIGGDAVFLFEREAGDEATMTSPTCTRPGRGTEAVTTRTSAHHGTAVMGLT